MSVYLNTYEEVKINNTNSISLGACEMLANYIKTVNELVYVELGELSLCVDGVSITLGEDDLFSYEEMEEQKLAWPLDHPFEDLVKKIASAKEILFTACYGVELHGCAEAGLEYWRDFFESNAENEQLRQDVEYRCLERCDSWKVQKYSFTKSACGDVGYASQQEKSSENGAWYCYEMQLRVGEGEELEVSEELAQKLADFYNTYDTLYDARDCAAGSLFCDCTIVEDAALPELVAALRDIVRLIEQAGCTVEFFAEFEPDDAKAFAAMRIVYEEGDMRVEYCSF